MFFGDVDNKFFYEVQSRDGFGNGPVIFVSGVMKGYVFAVVIINTGCSDDRSAEVSADVFNGDIGSAEIWLCADIKTFGMFLYISFLTLRKAGPIREESCSSSTLRKALRRKP